MKRSLTSELLVFAFLVSLGALTRIYFHQVHAFPNFSPVAAMSLFAGYFFSRRGLATAVAPCVMVASDSVIGGYVWQMMLVVYAMLTLPSALGMFMQNRLVMKPGKARMNWASGASLLACSLSSSILFFAVTNLVWWPWSNLYEKSLAGLFESYERALPFFKYTLAGDVVFGLLLFGIYGLLVQINVLNVSSNQKAETTC